MGGGAGGRREGGEWITMRGVRGGGAGRKCEEVWVGGDTEGIEREMTEECRRPGGSMGEDEG